MSRKFCLIGALGIFPCLPLFAQTNIVVGAGYTSPAHLYAAPGQVVTLFVNGIAKSLTQAVRAPDGAWPNSLAGISVTLLQGTKIPVPMLEVRPIPTCGPPFGFQIPCGQITAVTVQIPYDLIPLCPLCLRPVGPSPELVVTESGQDGAAIGISPLADQVHVLTSCDILLQPDSPLDFTTVNLTGLPCPPMVIHGDGTLVSAANPAKPGEELAAYTVGLGPTNPASREGQPAPAPIHTVQTFLIDYNFRANALPTKPAAESPAPLFTGLTPKYPGLYQINFVVPPIPKETKPCAGPVAFGATNFIQSNLTVSFGGSFSFDGAGICVASSN
jgi:hypothetical protein